jgi:hypothetical protein
MLPDDLHHVRQRKSTRWPRHAHSQARGAPAAWNWPACPASGTSGAASSSAASSGVASTQRWCPVKVGRLLRASTRSAHVITNTHAILARRHACRAHGTRGWFTRYGKPPRSATPLESRELKRTRVLRRACIRQAEGMAAARRVQRICRHVVATAPATRRESPAAPPAGLSQSQCQQQRRHQRRRCSSTA